MCSYASAKTESAGYCEAMICMNVCSAQIGAVLNFSLRSESFCLRWLSGSSIYSIDGGFFGFSVYILLSVYEEVKN